MKRIVMLSLVLALLGAMAFSTAAFAGNGPGDGTCPGGGGQFGPGEGQGAPVENGNTYGPGDGSGPIEGGQFGPGGDTGNGYGPGDGSGPVEGGQWGPGECLDLNNNGICDCQE